MTWTCDKCGAQRSCWGQGMIGFPNAPRSITEPNFADATIEIGDLTRANADLTAKLDAHVQKVCGEPVAWFYFDKHEDEWKHLCDSKEDADRYDGQAVAFYAPTFTTDTKGQSDE